MTNSVARAEDKIQNTQLKLKKAIIKNNITEEQMAYLKFLEKILQAIRNANKTSNDAYEYAHRGIKRRYN